MVRANAHVSTTKCKSVNFSVSSFLPSTVEVRPDELFTKSMHGKVEKIVHQIVNAILRIHRSHRVSIATSLLVNISFSLHDSARGQLLIVRTQNSQYSYS